MTQPIIAGLLEFSLFFVILKEIAYNNRRKKECLREAGESMEQQIVIETNVPSFIQGILVLLMIMTLFGGFIFFIYKCSEADAVDLSVILLALQYFIPLEFLFWLSYQEDSTYILDLEKRQIFHVLKFFVPIYKESVCLFSDILTIEMDKSEFVGSRNHRGRSPVMSRPADGQIWDYYLVAVCQDGSRHKITNTYREIGHLPKLGSIVASRTNTSYQEGKRKVPKVLHIG